MKPNLILVAYSEVALKSPRVRRRMENLLLNQLKERLKRRGYGFGEAWKEGGRIFLGQPQAEASAPLAAKVFGVDYAAPTVKTVAEMEAIVQTALTLMEEKVKGRGSFAVRARRIGVHPFRSRDLEREVGRAVLQKFKELRVDLENPELLLRIEVRGENAYLYLDVYRGPGGLPMGSQGEALSLLDSPQAAAATWLTMKRGVKPSLYIPWAKDENLRLARKLAAWTAEGKIKVYQALLKKTFQALQKLEFEARWLLWEQAKIEAASLLAGKLRLPALITGLTLDGGLEAPLKLLSLSRKPSLLILTPLAGLKNGGDAFKALKLVKENLKWEVPAKLPSLEETLRVRAKLRLEEKIGDDMEGLEELTVEEG